MATDFYRPLLSASQIPDSVVDKWGYEMCQEGFVPFPKMLLRVLKDTLDPDHAINDLIVILGIADLISSRNRKHAVSLEFLIFNIGLDEEIVIESLERLKKLDYLRLDKKETHRFRPVFTGISRKVIELCQEADNNFIDDEFSLPGKNAPS